MQINYRNCAPKTAWGLETRQQCYVTRNQSIEISGIPNNMEDGALEDKTIKILEERQAKTKLKPWITSGILKSMSKRDSYFRKFLKCKNPEIKKGFYNSYKTYPNLIITLTRCSTTPILLQFTFLQYIYKRSEKEFVL